MNRLGTENYTVPLDRISSFQIHKESSFIVYRLKQDVEAVDVVGAFNDYGLWFHDSQEHAEISTIMAAYCGGSSISSSRRPSVADNSASSLGLISPTSIREMENTMRRILLVNNTSPQSHQQQQQPFPVAHQYSPQIPMSSMPSGGSLMAPPLSLPIHNYSQQFTPVDPYTQQHPHFLPPFARPVTFNNDTRLPPFVHSMPPTNIPAPSNIPAGLNNDKPLLPQQQRLKQLELQLKQILAIGQQHQQFPTTASNQHLNATTDEEENLVSEAEDVESIKAVPNSTPSLPLLPDSLLCTPKPLSKQPIPAIKPSISSFTSSTVATNTTPRKPAFADIPSQVIRASLSSGGIVGGQYQKSVHSQTSTTTTGTQVTPMKSLPGNKQNKNGESEYDDGNTGISSPLKRQEFLKEYSKAVSSDVKFQERLYLEYLRQFQKSG